MKPLIILAALAAGSVATTSSVRAQGLILLGV